MDATGIVLRDGIQAGDARDINERVHVFACATLKLYDQVGSAGHYARRGAMLAERAQRFVNGVCSKIR